MMSSSITLSLVGLLVGWMMNASTPRTFSPISTKLSPSLKRVTRHFPTGVSRYWAIAAARAGLAFPENRQTFLNTRAVSSAGRAIVARARLSRSFCFTYCQPLERLLARTDRRPPPGTLGGAGARRLGRGRRRAAWTPVGVAAIGGPRPRGPRGGRRRAGRRAGRDDARARAR